MALSAVKVRSQGSKSKTESSLAHLETAFHCFQISVEVKPLWEEKRGGRGKKRTNTNSSCACTQPSKEQHLPVSCLGDGDSSLRGSCARSSDLRGLALSPRMRVHPSPVSSKHKGGKKGEREGGGKEDRKERDWDFEIIFQI